MQFYVELARIYARVGDIFCIDNVNGKYKRYFQYIARDKSYMESQVIRVFKKNYLKNSSPNIRDIVEDEVDFYAHVVLQQGIKDGTWCKIGGNADVGDIDKVYFRWCSSVFSKKAYDWYIWRINGDFEEIGELAEAYRQISLGGIYPPFQILHKIKTGKYTIGNIM